MTGNAADHRLDELTNLERIRQELSPARGKEVRAVQLIAEESSISDMQQLTVMAVPLQYESTINRSTHRFTGDKEIVVIFIHGNEKFESSVLNLSEFIINRSTEATFADRILHSRARR